MAQQTSVEWLVDKVFGKNGLILYAEVIEQAKAMHKEETMDAFQAGKWDWSEHTNNGKHSMDPAEYYNETFKSQ
jgi:hypothetical protein